MVRNKTSNGDDDRAAPASDLLYGVPAIADFLGLRERQARELVDKGRVPSFKIGGRICARRSTLSAWIKTEEAKANDDDFAR